MALSAFIALFVVLCGYALIVDDYTQWDATVSYWVQLHRSTQADQWMLAITLLADLPLSTVLFLGLVILLLVNRHWWLSCYLSCTFLITVLGVAILKSLTQRSRPELTESVLSLMSFPSGHAARAVLVFGAFALLLSCGRNSQARTIALLLAGFLSVSVAASRVYLGVHWTSDVLAGATLAMVMLTGLDWQLRLHEEELACLPVKTVLLASTAGYLVYGFHAMTTQSLVYGVGVGG